MMQSLTNKITNTWSAKQFPLTSTNLINLKESKLPETSRVMRPLIKQSPHKQNIKHLECKEKFPLSSTNLINLKESKLPETSRVMRPLIKQSPHKQNNKHLECKEIPPQFN
ncbi:hypothetical protein HS088_TW02G00154 [Tripterygium wilfordii]|uniref:Uncharacterized protein n=1 Tax=Tripterygium wilfordii TaxID=458696 RepID=A0A7J7DY90_TRIWF|nr:hypothetical protein HS088_TW02G00154 [Tripterygium wilfordii]